ncbi:SHQ1-domain-containing protein [Fomitopsis serialis]|uniref:SHQ1-domain-containing protein n=1 Tax=Fomitopsis serialis TaxID=139415 RepID=UPI0020086F5D|nr:SHQ1-domain-containing protein [Neoantrodia serialis]KAH9934938.1 SHQ1-domain-containing protein [Neoantrodia serialis]
MITPRFSCSQTDTEVVVKMYCPSVRASDVEINIDEKLFSVHVNPYFLRLNFSHPLKGDDDASASYDAGSGYLTVTLTKETPGQDFQDLDLLAKLLAPRPSEQPPQQPVIEVLSSEDTAANEEDADEELARRTQRLTLEQEEILRAAENDWQLPQEVPQPLPQLKTTPEYRYGFLDMHSGYFRHVTHTENEVNEIGADAETCPPSERRKRRLKHEDEKWDEEYYMADYVEDEYIQELLHWQNPHTDSTEGFHYSEEDNATMLRLPRKEYLAMPQQTHDLYLTLLTLLLSYAYDCRTTQHDPTPESAWTLSVLTPAFSALDPAPYSAEPPPPDPDKFSAEELSATFSASYRRVFAFPLYRSWVLAEKCRADVAALLGQGKRVIARCLLEMKHILDHHEVYYIYSKVWLDDFCVWTLAYASDETLHVLAATVKSLKMEKSMIGRDLDELEASAQEAMRREPDSDDESEDEIERMLPAPL